MSIAEVKNLKNQNRFEEAFRMSKTDFEMNPLDIWYKRSHAWALYYMIRKHIQAGESEKANNYYTEFESLAMPEDETLIHERMGYFKQVLSANYLTSKQLVQEGRFEEAFDLHLSDENVKSESLAWALYYLARNQNKSKNPDKHAFLNRLEIFRIKAVPQKKLVYKLLLQELIKCPLDFWNNLTMTVYLEALGLFEVLEPEDFDKQEYNGKKIISLAERLHIAYSKALIREKAPRDKVKGYLVNVVEPRLEICKGMLYVPYFKAKLLLEIGDREEGMQAFLPFAQKKQGEFWVWQVFAEYYQEDHEMYLSCLCKALMCKVKPEFLSGIKERLIGHQIKLEEFDWAKTEMNHLLQIRERQGWGMRTLHRNLLETDWYHNSKEISLKNRYGKYLSPAKKLVGSGNPKNTQVEIPLVVEFVNEQKRIFHFLTKEKIKGFAKYKIKPETGGLYVLEGMAGERGYYEIQKLKVLHDEGLMNHLRKTVSGILRQSKGKSFGFVEGIFINPEMVQQHKLQDGQMITGVAIFSAVKGKTEWAWRMVKLEN